MLRMMLKDDVLNNYNYDGNYNRKRFRDLTLFGKVLYGKIVYIITNFMI